MGRKIPAKKHKGVKDPLKQQAQRLHKLKTKINAPPTDPDEQPVPRSLTRLFAFREPPSDKNARKKKKQRITYTSESRVGAGALRNPVQQLAQLPGEPARAFGRRINSAVRHLSGPTDPMHYPVDFEEDDVKGQQMMIKREKRQQKRRKREKEERIARGEPRKKPEEGHEPPRPHRMDLKKAARKAKAAEMAAGRAEVQYERVAFGEVCSAPPALPPPRRAAAPPAGAPRPGRRPLLLSGLLGAGGAGGAGGSAAGPAPAPAAAPAAALERERRERARLAAVDAYRALKLQKAKSKSSRHVVR